MHLEQFKLCSADGAVAFTNVISERGRKCGQPVELDIECSQTSYFVLGLQLMIIFMINGLMAYLKKVHRYVFFPTNVLSQAKKNMG